MTSVNFPNGPEILGHGIELELNNKNSHISEAISPGIIREQKIYINVKRKIKDSGTR